MFEISSKTGSLGEKGYPLGRCVILPLVRWIGVDGNFFVFLLLSDTPGL